MQKYSKQTRKGDTSRTSSQGRKLSSGPKKNKKGDPDINEDTKNQVKIEKPNRRRVPAGAITK
ncbi:MAG TPA: hypothetical protein VJ765_06055 [Chitinophagaceae bacterium]|nr:hypothetical protein [Chitinophagaceae bacterium]